jgi:hypothetical protein
MTSLPRLVETLPAFYRRPLERQVRLNDHERRCGAIPIDGHAVAIHAQQTTIGKYQAAYKEYYRSHGSCEEQDLALIAGQGFIQLD